MLFESFDKNRCNLENQYARFRVNADKVASEALYAQIRNIYYSETSKQIGKGKAIKCFFENVELFINPDDVFADIIDILNTPIKIRDEEYNYNKEHNNEAEIMRKEGAFRADSDFGHTMPEWNIIFRIGITGIINRAEDCLKKSGLSNEQKEFYLSVKYAYEGVLIYIKRLKKKALTVKSVNAQFAALNLGMLETETPNTLAEAMQLYFIYYTAQHYVEGENLRSLGALDDILYPFYKHDIDNGILNEQEARELIKYFLFKWNSMQILANIPFNLCTHTNEMTYLILEEYSKLNVPDPKIHIKCSDKTPHRVYEIVMESIRNGNNSFVFTNDEVIQRALINIGVEPEDAKDYTLIGCYEPGVVGKEIPCTLNGRINMPMAIETVMNRGKKFSSEYMIGSDFGDDFLSFEEFYSAIKKQLTSWTEIAMREINAIEMHYPEIIQSPVLSATFEDCMENGIDAYAGGAKYNNSSICAFGIATAVDAIMAIKKAVFDERIISYHELRETLKNNWTNNESLRKIMQDKYPKYGNNDNEADELAVDLLNHMAECINNKPNGRGGVYRMGLFSIDWIIDYGRRLGATADGRFAGEPVSKNLCASVGMDKKGVTGIINSATKFDYSLSPNGAVLDLHLHPSAVSGDEGIGIMISLLKIFMAKGGFATHINVVSSETLKKAQKNPEKYKNLQVRLCGWNVYFTDLDIEMQNNLIKSMEA